MNWTPFHFEANQYFGWIDTPELWQEVLSVYPDALDAQEATYRGTRSPDRRDSEPNYGFRLEHDGERTLRDFFAVTDNKEITQCQSPLR